MSRIVTSGLTTFNLGTHLDPQTLDLYGIADWFRTPDYVGSKWAIAIDSSNRMLSGSATAVPTRFAATVINAVRQLIGTTIAGASSGQFVFDSASASTAPYLLFGRSRNATPGSHTVIQNGDALGRISAAGSDGTNFCEAARIEFSCSGAPATDSAPGQIRFLTTSDAATTPNSALVIEKAGHTRPGADNSFSAGTAANRWSVVYAATGTINTSDAREKTPVRGFTEAEIAAAKQLAGEVGFFQFLASVQDKGDDAREHCGMTVQRAMEVMAAHGLDPLRYGFICHDQWPETTEPAEWRQRNTGLVDEHGQPVMEDVLVRPTRRIPAGDRYSFRPDELNLFLARGFEARLAALEAAA